MLGWSYFYYDYTTSSYRQVGVDWVIKYLCHDIILHRRKILPLLFNQPPPSLSFFFFLSLCFSLCLSVCLSLSLSLSLRHTQTFHQYARMLCNYSVADVKPLSTLNYLTRCHSFNILENEWVFLQYICWM